MTWKLFWKIECSHFQLCDYSGVGGEKIEKHKIFSFLIATTRKVLIVNIASIFIHNVIIECDSNMFLSSNKLKSIERNESISFSFHIWLKHMHFSLRNSMVNGFSWVCWKISVINSTNFSAHLWLFMMDIEFYRYIFSSALITSGFVRELIHDSTLRQLKFWVFFGSHENQARISTPKTIVFDFEAKNI